MPWHKGSVFGDGIRRRLDRDGRARFRFILDLHRKSNRLTRAQKDVGQALLKSLGDDGRCDPAHATLAERASCCESTVDAAVKAMRDLGMVRWVTRLVRTGRGTKQTSNAYELLPFLKEGNFHLGTRRSMNLKRKSREPRQLNAPLAATQVVYNPHDAKIIAAICQARIERLKEGRFTRTRSYAGAQKPP